jgi:hypothetical protein
MLNANAPPAAVPVGFLNTTLVLNAEVTAQNPVCDATVMVPNFAISVSEAVL